MDRAGRQPGAKSGFVAGIAVVGMKPCQPRGCFRPDFG
jgi:hypothetical protein